MDFPEILEIKTRFHLKEILDKGLINLYQEIFGEPPEYQVWSETKIEYFLLNISSTGICL